jgi:hypothetical protein
MWITRQPSSMKQEFLTSKKIQQIINTEILYSNKETKTQTLGQNYKTTMGSWWEIEPKQIFSLLP